MTKGADVFEHQREDIRHNRVSEMCAVSRATYATPSYSSLAINDGKYALLAVGLPRQDRRIKRKRRRCGSSSIRVLQQSDVRHPEFFVVT